MSLVALSALLTGLSLYDDIAKHAGAGTLVPITGFANSVAAPAVEFKTEGFILGVGAKIFQIAGPVIVYGVSASVENIEVYNYDEDEDVEELINEGTSIGGKVKIDLQDMNIYAWKDELLKDKYILDDLMNEFKRITPEKDNRPIQHPLLCLVQTALHDAG